MEKTPTVGNPIPGNPWRAKQRSIHRPATSFALTDGYEGKPAKREGQLYDGCGSVQSIAFMEAQKMMRIQREAKEEERKQLELIIRRKELELDQLMTSRGEGISDRDLEAHKAHHSEPGDATQRAPTSRRATAAATRGGRRNVRSSTPNDVWKTSYFEQLCQMPGEQSVQPRDRQFESPQQFQVSGMQWRLEKLREIQRAEHQKLERTKGMSLPPDPSRKFQYGLASFPRGYLFEEVKVDKKLSDLFAETHRSRFPSASRHQRRFNTLASEGLEECKAATHLGKDIHNREFNGGGDVISWDTSKEPHYLSKTSQFKMWAGINAGMVSYGAKIF